MAEYIVHFDGVTLRVNGTGNLHMTLINLDETRTKELAPLIMQDAPGVEPFTLTNFNSQRARLRLSTTEMDEYMKIDKVILWTKIIYKSLPNGGRPRA